ncbi:ECF subfamily RNA polymerase sigma factor, BldN family [Streptomyces clavuligerus]|uniref:RNA polymerase ECF-subfamily sigma factor n=1 Tax=Streptomyces clavuligerus TaxID=1901 RepID=E2Q7L6_STRCL|nr:ECF subfamily RNA polymerase sigma factor, BldN family [Streptomyces clavuligerus]ANW19734.1 RNA polymerase subunit sigma-24 [Streptomyces clavuligerus]AXU14348.1 sigma-70 family RNA polymerase sigma factor [Streptomyces clavuligerus]EFG07422.1 RNA polymerase ECF-subfamily sigma factor [Streptomyces clavuligerus]MBY6304351.1 sigma-70 family RNA polymerase sigma factor [Streptomyces clavuligerus]QCS07122.1 RNA polymerase subunit sigma-24 [Streptomyces clavuligerus]
MYPHVGVDASGLATLRAAVLDHLRGCVPAAHFVSALALPRLATGGPPTTICYALADGFKESPARSAVVEGRRPGGGRGVARRSGRGSHSASTTARRPSADSDSARMMELVERAQAGEAEAFGRLYDQYSDTVYRYIYYRVGGKATAEDLTSETFLRALRRISTFTWQGRDFGAWLVTIARNLVADHFKSSRFRLEVTTGEMLDANEVERSPEDSVLESLSNAALLEAVRKLNPQQQECVTLRFLQGLSVAETARAMGKNEGAIKTLQYRAVRTLARLLPDDAR